MRNEKVSISIILKQDCNCVEHMEESASNPVLPRGVTDEDEQGDMDHT